jgi:phenylpropionate dioxygenase-like ring-hydroxylating dioxygenase large terminal subunit
VIRNTWYAAGFSGEFAPGALGGQVIAGRPLVLWRTQAGAVAALDARCAHKRFPLWEGRLLGGDVLECAYHGFAYDAGGRCVKIPALHEQDDKIPQTARQRAFPVAEQDGVVWLWPGDAEPAAAPPRTPEIGSAAWETISTEPMEIAANARLLIENLFDLTHFYPLHADNIGSLADAMVPVEIERGGHDGIPYLRTIRRRSSFTLPPMTRDRFGLEVADQVQRHTMVGPGLFHVVVTVAPPGRLGSDQEQGFVLYQTITPRDDAHHVWRRSISAPAGARWAGSPGQSLAEAVAAGAPAVVAQDRWAIEQQQAMFAFPDEGYREVHIRTDGAVVMARRILDDLEAAEGSSSPAQVGSQRARRTAGPA